MALSSDSISSKLLGHLGKLLLRHAQRLGGLLGVALLEGLCAWPSLLASC